MVLVRSRRLTALAVGGLAVVLGGVTVMALAAPSRSARQPALLEVVSDTVYVAPPTGRFDSVVGTTMLNAGDRVLTDASGRALITYADGTTVMIGESSQFSYVVSESSVGDAIVTMIQSAGRIWYTITRTILPRSRYELHLPGGAAVVRAGTAIQAFIDDDGTTTIVTTAGSVDVAAGGVSVAVGPGQQTVVRRGSPPSTPRPVPPSPSTPSAPATSAPASSTPAPETTPTSSSAPTTPTPSPTQAPTPTATPTQVATPTATPTPVPTATPLPTPSLPLPSLLPSPTPTPTASATATPAPSALPTVSLPPIPTPTLPSLP